MSAHFKTLFAPPAGGYFYEYDGESVSAKTFVEIEPKVLSILLKHKLSLTVEEAVAGYMCPRIPEASWLCTGGFSEAKIRPADALKNSFAITDGKDVVPFDDIERRLRICMSCPMHTREFCVTCTGHMERIMLSFGGRRQKVPEDAGSGICKCAKAYESAIASVEYGNAAPWDGIPEGCWRNMSS